MSEPRTRAGRVEQPRPGLWHWSIDDERLGFRSDAYAVDTPAGRVAIDPLPLDAALVERLAPVARICLSGAFHQRAAWRLAGAWGAAVLAARDAGPLDGTPDGRFEDGDAIAPGLVARHLPGPNDPHHVLEWRPEPGTLVVFTGDLVIRAEGTGPFGFVPPEHERVPGRSRASVERVLASRPTGLCSAHGGVQLADAEAALRAALAGSRG